MKRQISIFLLLLLFSVCHSQSKTELSKLKNYSSYVLKSYHTSANWSIKYILKNGFIQEEENYKNDEFMSVLKNKYDRNKIIYQVLTFKNKFNDQKMDTLNERFLKYDDKNRLTELRYVVRFSVTKLTDDAVTLEVYSNFDKNSNAKVINRYDGNYKPIYYRYGKENREFDKKGNLIKEEKIEFENIQKGEPLQILKTETDMYQYDKYGNVTELKRSFEPKKDLPYTGLDGLTIYESENYEYEYNDVGLWLKKYLVVEGKKKLLEERIFVK